MMTIAVYVLGVVFVVALLHTLWTGFVPPETRDHISLRQLLSDAKDVVALLEVAFFVSLIGSFLYFVQWVYPDIEGDEVAGE